jgi:hypothetical protein
MSAALVAQSSRVPAQLREVRESRRVGGRRGGAGGLARLGAAVVNKVQIRNPEVRYEMMAMNRTISTLETADEAAEDVLDLLRELRGWAAEAGSRDLPRHARAGLSERFEDALEDLREMTRDTSEEGQRVADGSERMGMFERAAVALPPTDLRPEHLGIADVDLWSPEAATDGVSRIDMALGEVVAQRAEIAAAGVDVLGATATGLLGEVPDAVEEDGDLDDGPASRDDALLKRADALSRDVADTFAETPDHRVIGRTHELDRNAALRVLGYPI